MTTATTTTKTQPHYYFESQKAQVSNQLNKKDLRVCDCMHIMIYGSYDCQCGAHSNNQAVPISKQSAPIDK